jgi:hypothetical protein
MSQRVAKGYIHNIKRRVKSTKKFNKVGRMRVATNLAQVNISQQASSIYGSFYRLAYKEIQY